MSKLTTKAAVVPASQERIGVLTELKRVEGSGSGTTIERLPVERSQQSYEWTSKINREDKQSGRYERYTRKEKASGGEPFVEKRTGQVGVKDEYQKSTTVKVGNKHGYTEIRIEERFRDVNFGKSFNSNNNDQGPNKYITCDDCDSDDDNGFMTGYDYSYEDDSDDDYY